MASGWSFATDALGAYYGTISVVVYCGFDCIGLLQSQRPKQGCLKNQKVMCRFVQHEKGSCHDSQGELDAWYIDLLVDNGITKVEDIESPPEATSATVEEVDVYVPQAKFVNERREQRK